MTSIAMMNDFIALCRL